MRGALPFELLWSMSQSVAGAGNQSGQTSPRRAEPMFATDWPACTACQSLSQVCATVKTVLLCRYWMDGWLAGWTDCMPASPGSWQNNKFPGTVWPIHSSAKHFRGPSRRSFLQAAKAEGLAAAEDSPWG